ncbi:MAG: hypothetical protein AAFU81_01560 [Pseudomonadota bacterium]
MLKDYVDGNLALWWDNFRFRGMPEQFKLLIHGVPLAAKAYATNEEASAKIQSSDNRLDLDTDGMFSVCHLGDFSGQIWGAGRTWRSRVWLLSEKLFDQSVWEARGRFLKSLPDAGFETLPAVSPRVSPAIDAESHRSAIDRSVISVFEVEYAVPDQMPDGIGRSVDHLDYMDVLSSCRIYLNHLGKGVLLEVGVDDGARALSTTLCPVDLLLDSLKITHDDPIAQNASIVMEDCDFVWPNGQSPDQ